MNTMAEKDEEDEEAVFSSRTSEGLKSSPEAQSPQSPYSNFKRTGSQLYAFEIDSDDDDLEAVTVTQEAVTKPSEPEQHITSEITSSVPSALLSGATAPEGNGSPLGVSNTLGIPRGGGLTSPAAAAAAAAAAARLNRDPILGLKIIALDLDGTMVDSCPDLADACDKAMKDLGRPGLTVEQCAGYIGNGADVLVSRALSQSVQVAPDLDPALVKQARALFDKHYKASGHVKTTMFPHVAETLAELQQRGYQLAVLTNKPSAFVPGVLAHQGIAEYFSSVIGGDTLSRKKPDPIGLVFLMHHYIDPSTGLGSQCSPRELLMVGDSRNDIECAQNAESYSCGITYGYNYGVPIGASNPDRCIDDFSDLLHICPGFTAQPPGASEAPLAGLTPAATSSPTRVVTLENDDPVGQHRLANIIVGVLVVGLIAVAVWVARS